MKLNKADTARQAIEQLIESEDRLPAISQIRVAYLALRKREEEADAKAIPPPAEPGVVRRLPVEVRAWIDGLQTRDIPGRVDVDQTLEKMPVLDMGRCDDCGRDADGRRQFGRLGLCVRCVTRRVRVATKLETAGA